MADKKISQLTALSAANLAPSTDVLAVVDTSATETKKIVAQDLINGVLNVASAVGIGTASPSYKLDVRGSGSIVSWSDGTTPGVLYSTGGYVGLTFPAQSGGFFINPTGNFCTISTSGIERVRIDSSGNLGLGVTPSAWASSWKVLQSQGGFVGSNATSGYFISNNSYSDGTNWRRVSAEAASQYLQSAGAHSWYSAGSSTAGSTISWTQAMTLASGGELWLGTSSGATSSNYTIFEIKGKAGLFSGQIKFNSGDGTNTGLLFLDVNGLCSGTDGAYPVRFYTNGTERARITSGGKFLLNTTSTVVSGDEIFGAIGTNGLGVKSTGGASSFAAGFWNDATSGNNVFVNFYTETGGTNRGSINYNRVGGLIAYNTTSDYRAKDVYGLLDGSGETIDALKVYRGKMHGATMERPMLIAHEAQEIAPYAVTGEKDAVNEDGTPKFQQMDTSSLVPLLIAEIQSLRSRVAALEAK